MKNEGIATRDFIYVKDMVQGLMLCATNGEDGEVYNLASGKETSILQLAELVNEITNNPTPTEYLGKRDWDRSGKSHGSTQKAREKIGFDCKVDFKAGLT